MAGAAMADLAGRTGAAAWAAFVLAGAWAKDVMEANAKDASKRDLETCIVEFS